MQQRGETDDEHLRLQRPRAGEDRRRRRGQGQPERSRSGAARPASTPTAPPPATRSTATATPASAPASSSSRPRRASASATDGERLEPPGLHRDPGHPRRLRLGLPRRRGQRPRHAVDPGHRAARRLQRRRRPDKRARLRPAALRHQPACSWSRAPSPSARSSDPTPLSSACAGRDGPRPPGADGDRCRVSGRRRSLRAWCGPTRTSWSGCSRSWRRSRAAGSPPTAPSPTSSAADRGSSAT